MTVVDIAVSGETTHMQTFYNFMTKNDDGSFVVRAVHERIASEQSISTQLQPVYQGSFPVTMIDAFIKNVPSKMIVARLQTGHPMLLQQMLGPEGMEEDGSFIHFLVGPVAQDENE